ncbi:hypothetical protein TNCV_3908911 [Trichonephila clavipes]|nr:hypothetical protein TNCV_3908911 [Trichonephila clavipes]
MVIPQCAMNAYSHVEKNVMLQEKLIGIGTKEDFKAGATEINSVAVPHIPYGGSKNRLVTLTLRIPSRISKIFPHSDIRLENTEAELKL